MAVFVALLKASLHPTKFNENTINKLMIYFLWNLYEWRTTFTAVQQDGEQVCVCGKGPGTWGAASWAQASGVSWQQTWPTASHPTHPTWWGFLGGWLLKIKARHAKDLILITYSFDLLRKRIAGEMLEKKLLCF